MRNGLRRSYETATFMLQGKQTGTWVPEPTLPGNRVYQAVAELPLDLRIALRLGQRTT
jgi:hypothetical protein